MGISIRWMDDAQTILLQRYDARWTPVDFYQVVKVSAFLIQERHTFVDLLIDLTDNQERPVQLVSGAWFIQQNVTPYHRLAVLVNPGKLTPLITTAFARHLPKASPNLRTVESIEAGLALIQHYRARLVVPHSTTPPPSTGS